MEAKIIATARKCRSLELRSQQLFENHLVGRERVNCHGRTEFDLPSLLSAEAGFPTQARSAPGRGYPRLDKTENPPILAMMPSKNAGNNLMPGILKPHMDFHDFESFGRSQRPACAGSCRASSSAVAPLKRIE